MLGRVPLARGAVFVEWVGGACGRKVKFGSTYSISLYGNIDGLGIGGGGVGASGSDGEGGIGSGEGDIVGAIYGSRDFAL